ncbi:MAG TPA: DUF58 domain-containing protein [Bdellovibrionota bacterium]|nr:DUF58 domain-containing protein [Bdellovibrionota bacterium]
MTSSRGRFRIHVTRTGYLFILLCLGIGIASLNTGNNLLYLIFAMMLSFLILSGLLSNNTLARLWVHPRFPARIFAKQPVPVRLELENKKRFFPSFCLSLDLAAQGIEKRGKPFVIKVPPGGSASVTDHIVFPLRGRRKLPPYSVETSYPFGLIRKYFPLPSEGDTVVYPALAPIEFWLEADRRLHGEFLSGQKGGETNPYGIRDYVHGDPARLIHWKSSAKQGSWKSREFEKEKKLRVVVDVRLLPQSESEPEWLERAISVAASLILMLSRRGFEIVLRLNGDRVIAEGKGYLDAYLTALALARAPIEGNRPEAFRDIPEVHSVVVVTDAPSHGSGGEWVIGRERLQAA